VLGFAGAWRPLAAPRGSGRRKMRDREWTDLSIYQRLGQSGRTPFMAIPAAKRFAAIWTLP